MDICEGQGLVYMEANLGFCFLKDVTKLSLCVTLQAATQKRASAFTEVGDHHLVDDHHLDDGRHYLCILLLVATL